ncbi:MAG: hypothetical protein KKH68_02035 [Proteobacteria bacterium]|nr:hypothetical protein [Pseudomonadota bacterium]
MKLKKDRGLGLSAVLLKFLICVRNQKSRWQTHGSGLATTTNKYEYLLFDFAYNRRSWISPDLICET